MSDPASASLSPQSSNPLAVLKKPWIWAYIAAATAFSATMLISGGQGAGSLFYTAMTFASFAAIVGIGQMLVITLGPGNVDLSIPSSMTLAATLALKVMNSEPNMVLPGLATALLVGLACGIFNFSLIMLLRIPPLLPLYPPRSFSSLWQSGRTEA